MQNYENQTSLEAIHRMNLPDPSIYRMYSLDPYQPHC
jgi:hypothetical protein